MRRSYGDSAYNSNHHTIDMTRLDRVLSFNPETGVIRAEAGLTIDQLLQIIVPTGWFVPTTPGTRYITLGGATANDVHGKNHHRVGTFGNWIKKIGIHRSDTGTQTACPSHNPDLFTATIGGLGLTGVILWVEIQLLRVGSSYLSTSVKPFNCLEDYFELSTQTSQTHEHSVAWVDCLSRGEGSERGLFNASNWLNDGLYEAHANVQNSKMPFNLPSGIMNRHSVRLFNQLYFARGAKKSKQITQHYGDVFHPLDAIANWNRLYGKRGFYQYQCVIPSQHALTGIRKLIAQIAASGQGSFLAVLKNFGDIRSPGLLSFPMPGTTLALDFPVAGKATHTLFNKLDSIVLDHGGRLYAAKDMRMTYTLFTQGLNQSINSFREQIDPGISSNLRRRLSL